MICWLEKIVWVVLVIGLPGAVVVYWWKVNREINRMNARFRRPTITAPGPTTHPVEQLPTLFPKITHLGETPITPDRKKKNYALVQRIASMMASRGRRVEYLEHRGICSTEPTFLVYDSWDRRKTYHLNKTEFVKAGELADRMLAADYN